MIRGRLGQDQEAGFTLIELVAALAVFALAAGSLLAVLVVGIRTAGIARDRTVGKDLARQQLEEMRRLSYHQDWATFSRKVDLLDFYFPDAGQVSPTGYDAGDSTYTIVIDPVDGHPRYRLEIVSRFVDEDLDTVTPPATYIHNNASNDDPPSRLLSVEVSSIWTVNERGQEFSVRSLLGEARLEDVKVQASVTASILNVATAFSDTSTLIAEGGKGFSSVFEGNVTTARNDTQAALIHITAPDGTSTELSGAHLVAGAPPDTPDPGLSESNPGGFLTHPSTGLDPIRTCLSGSLIIPRCVGVIGPNRVGDPDRVFAKVSSVLPTASGGARVNDAGDDFSVGLGVTNEVETTTAISDASGAFLDPGQPYVRAIKVTGSNPVRVKTSCEQTTDDVSCEAGGDTDEIQMIPLDSAALSAIGVTSAPPAAGYLITAEFSSVAVSATAARPLGLGTAATDVSYLGTLFYYTWNPATSAWVSNEVCMSTDPGDDCAAGTATSLPVPSSVCVFPDAAGGCLADLSEYVTGWSLGAGTTSIINTGRTAEAILGGALRVITTPTNPDFANTNFIVTVGAMRVRAEDLR